MPSYRRHSSPALWTYPNVGQALTPSPLIMATTDVKQTRIQKPVHELSVSPLSSTSASTRGRSGLHSPTTHHAPESTTIHINLRRYNPSTPHSRLSVLHVSAIKFATDPERKSSILSDLRFHLTSKLKLKLGSYTAWSSTGLWLNFQTDRIMWETIDRHQEWLPAGAVITEAWGIIVIKNLVRPHSWSSNMYSGSKYESKYAGELRGLNSWEEGRVYRIRKYRWMRQHLVVSFHDVEVANWFLEKGIFFVPGEGGEVQQGTVGKWLGCEACGRWGHVAKDCWNSKTIADAFEKGGQWQ